MKNHAGKRFGRLVAIQPIGKHRSGKIMWACQCDCGKYANVPSDSLVTGNTRSCGCLKTESLVTTKLTHGQSYSYTYRKWLSMRGRCLNKQDAKYYLYGGRGITICQAWLDSFATFLTDMGECPKGLTLERIDSNGNYEPSNCRWATLVEQGRNRRCNKLTQQSADMIKAAQGTITSKELAALFDITPSMVRIIWRGESWA